MRELESLAYYTLALISALIAIVRKFKIAAFEPIVSKLNEMMRRETDRIIFGLFGPDVTPVSQRKQESIRVID